MLLQQILQAKCIKQSPFLSFRYFCLVLLSFSLLPPPPLLSFFFFLILSLSSATSYLKFWLLVTYLDLQTMASWLVVSECCISNLQAVGLSALSCSGQSVHELFSFLWHWIYCTILTFPPFKKHNVFFPIKKLNIKKLNKICIYHTWF